MSTEVLFKSFDHPKLQLKNRILMAPMTRQFSPNGIPDENVVKYYQRRAAGGVGLIITEGTTVDHRASSSSERIPSFHGAALESWQKVVEAVHASGGKIAPQLWHVGGIRKPGEGPYPKYPSATPSGLLAPGKKVLESLSVMEIDEIIAAFTDAAHNAKALGFDALELHGAHGYLIDNFFWDGTNQRDDRYGGSISRRTRFAVDILNSIRAEIGEDFPIILRFSQWKQQDFDSKLALNPEQLEEFLTPLSNAGVDIFHCSNRRFWDDEFEGSNMNLAGWTKKITGKPTISVGSVGLNQEFIANYQGGTAETAGIDKLLEKMEADEFDLIAVGRALIANPEWANMVKENKMQEMKTYSRELLTELA
ncbi:MAG: 12-oxophytodienoate reductase [SAR86 cluster bacterium]|uniref:12-oxophytodienoate reductase n=1 Tax=SAR86 cluster bacterium TaxID=2030880 RepID=A0A2A4MTI2_9GAMM|nr:MAG: 12-oxophytodienoate reductase [SAR86 cluster bacterium]